MPTAHRPEIAAALGQHLQCPIARSLERVGEWWSILIPRSVQSSGRGPINGPTPVETGGTAPYHARAQRYRRRKDGPPCLRP